MTGGGYVKGVAIALVTQNKDDEGLCRVKVRYPWHLEAQIRCRRHVNKLLGLSHLRVPRFRLSGEPQRLVACGVEAVAEEFLEYRAGIGVC